jgi:hypothetical protein
MRPAALLELENETLPAISEAAPPIELNLYWPGLLPKRRYLPSFLASVALHCIVIFVLPPLIDLLPESDDNVSKRLMRAMRSVEIRVPDRLYLPPMPPKAEKRPVLRPKPAEPAPAEVAKSKLPPPP